MKRLLIQEIRKLKSIIERIQKLNHYNKEEEGNDIDMSVTRMLTELQYLKDTIQDMNGIMERSQEELDNAIRIDDQLWTWVDEIEMYTNSYQFKSKSEFENMVRLYMRGESSR